MNENPQTAWRNGIFLSPDQLTISAADAGFVSGATITDFCRTYRHRLFRWPDHLRRFRRDCATVHIPLPFTDEILTAAAEELTVRMSVRIPESDDLAIITFATPGPLGSLLGTAANGPPTVGMHAFPLAKERYRRFFSEGATLAWAGYAPGDGILPAGVKHRSRLHWWLAEQAVRDPSNPVYCPGAVPVLTNSAGASPDTPIAAVLGVRDSQVIRPAPGETLDSITVAVIKEICQRVGIPFLVGEVQSEVDELILAGSGFGIAGVCEYVHGSKRVNYSWPGPITQRLTHEWTELTGVDPCRQFALSIRPVDSGR